PRKGHAELASLPRTLASRLHAPAVQFHQSLDQRQSNAKAALSASGPGLALSEHVEYPLQHVARDAASAVAYRDPNRVTVRTGRQPDATPRLGVPGRVVEQIRQNLGEPD